MTEFSNSFQNLPVILVMRESDVFTRILVTAVTGKELYLIDHHSDDDDSPIGDKGKKKQSIGCKRCYLITTLFIRTKIAVLSPFSINLLHRH